MEAGGSALYPIDLRPDQSYLAAEPSAPRSRLLPVTTPIYFTLPLQRLAKDGDEGPGPRPPTPGRTKLFYSEDEGAAHPSTPEADGAYSLSPGAEAAEALVLARVVSEDAKRSTNDLSQLNIAS